MLRINTSWLIETFSKIDDINVHYQPLANTYDVAKEALNSLVSNSILSGSLKASLNPTDELISLIDDAISKAETESESSSVFGPIIRELDGNTVKAKWLVVKPIILAEIGVLPVYFISPKGPYDTDSLINSGQLLFPPNLKEVFPDTINDAQMVGKALIYEMPTACAFHAFRILEAVSKGYIRKFATEEELKKVKTLGQIARELEDKKYGDTVISSALRDLVKLHRNPIIHPDINITLEQAMSLVGMSHSVLSPMLNHMQNSNTP